MDDSVHTSVSLCRCVQMCAHVCRFILVCARKGVGAGSSVVLILDSLGMGEGVHDAWGRHTGSIQGSSRPPRLGSFLMRRLEQFLSIWMSLLVIRGQIRSGNIKWEIPELTHSYNFYYCIYYNCYIISLVIVNLLCIINK